METVTITEAARRLGVSRTTNWSMVRAGELEARQDPVDKRRRLISSEAVTRLKRRTDAPRRLPRTLGIVDDGTVQSSDVKEYVRVHWHPEEC